MLLSIRSSALLALLAVLCMVQFTTALPGGLRPREDIELPELLGFVPACARQCVAARVAPKNCVGNGVENCLCGGDPQGFRNSIWQCIDGNCGGGDSSSHQAAVVGVEGLCGTPISTEISTSSVETSTQSSSRSSRSSSATAGPLVTETSSSSEVMPTSTAADFGRGDATENEKARAGLSAQAIVGISVGSFCLSAAVVGAFIFCMIRKRKNHRGRVQEMTLEPHSPRGGTAVVWMSASDTTLAGSYYSSDRRVPPIDTNVANQKLNAHRGGNISPVSPIISQGFEFGEAVQQQGRAVAESREIIGDPHLMAPAGIYTSVSPIGTADIVPSPIPPVLSPYRVRPTSDFSIHSYDGDLPGMAISTDLPGASFSPLRHSSVNHHTSSTIATISRPEPLTPPSPPPEYAPSPVSEGSGSTRSFIQITHGPPAVGISRSDTLSWRRELNQAAGRAVTRVLHSEQSVNEEMDAAKRRKGGIPGLDRFSRRLSRDNRADEESGLVGGERSSGFWSNFGSKSSRSSRNRGYPSRNPSKGGVQGD